MTTILRAFGLLAVFGPCGLAADIHVDGLKGDDVGGSGSAAAPFQTIGKGLGAASAGDRVLVAPAVYRTAMGEAFPLVVGSGVSLIATEGPHNTVIDGDLVDWTGISGMVDIKGDALVSGFTFRNGPTADWWSAAITGWGPGAVTIERNVFLGPNLNRGLVLFDLSAVPGSTSSAVVRNNVCAGIGPADGLLVFDYANVEVVNNTLDAGVRTGIAVTQINTAVSGLIANNCVTGHGFFGIEGNAPGVTLLNNNLFNNGPGTITGSFGVVIGTTQLDPLYVSAVDKDLHLQPTSPIRDLGAAVSATLDMDGEPVPADGLFDVGADEVWTPGTALRAPMELLTITAIDTIGTPGLPFVQMMGVAPGSVPTPFGVLEFDPSVWILVLNSGVLPASGAASTQVVVPLVPPSALGFPLIVQSLVGFGPNGLSKAKRVALIN